MESSVILESMKLRSASGSRKFLFLRFSKSILIMWLSFTPLDLSHSSNIVNNRYDLPLRLTPVTIFIR